MSSQFDELNEEDELRAMRRRQRIEEAKRQKRQQEIIRRRIRAFAPFVIGIFLILVVVITGRSVFHKISEGKEEVKKQQDNSDVAEVDTAGAGIPADGLQSSGGDSEDGSKEGDAAAGIGETQSEDSKKEKEVYSAEASPDTVQIGGDVGSGNAILIDLSTDKILAQRDAFQIISPASMTKILTVLVAAENIKKEDLEDTFTITIDITDYSYVNDCSNVGFDKDETVTVRDLFYGTILPSGADAAAGLAIYVAGSLEAFVDMMNEKLTELGLSKTAHFTNCVGIYDEDHYCTVYDMAMILEAAMNNELCKEVLSAHTYTTSSTEQHPEGITISNWFLRRIEDKDTHGEVVGGKTGFVVQSRNCAASYAEDKNGNGYICVTAGAQSSWYCIYDHVDLYQQFLEA